MTRWIKWGVILVLVLSVGWLCFQWGYTKAEEKAATQKNEAVQKAIKNQQEQFQKELAQVRSQAEQYQQRLKEANKTLDKKDQKIDELDDGDKQCLGKESLEAFNSY